jgi:hypothetical protein
MFKIILALQLLVATSSVFAQSIRASDESDIYYYEHWKAFAVSGVEQEDVKFNTTGRCWTKYTYKNEDVLQIVNEKQIETRSHYVFGAGKTTVNFFLYPIIISPIEPSNSSVIEKGCELNLNMNTQVYYRLNKIPFGLLEHGPILSFEIANIKSTNENSIVLQRDLKKNAINLTLEKIDGDENSCRLNAYIRALYFENSFRLLKSYNIPKNCSDVVINRSKY